MRKVLDGVAKRFCEIFSLSEDQFQTLKRRVDRAARVQEDEHNEDGIDSDPQIKLVEDFAIKVMKVDAIQWNGLYPTFVKDGQNYSMPDESA